MPLQINQTVRALGKRAQDALQQEFSRIDTIAEENTARVLAAFQEHRVAEGYFAGTTGYGSWTRSMPAYLEQKQPWCGFNLSMEPMQLPPPCLAP